MTFSSRRRLAAGVAAVVLACATAANAVPLRYVETVMTGLANPRGLTLGSDGAIYVAEAGSGGDGPTLISGDGFTVLGYGTTGAITRLQGGAQTRILSDLPSLAPTGGSQAHGVQDLAFGADGRLYATMGLGGDPRQLDAAEFSGLPGVNLVGTLAVRNGTSLDVFADVPQFEIDNNPDGGNIDTNIYGIAPDGAGFRVTDAGGNAVLAVDAAGNVSTVVVLPNRPNPPHPMVPPIPGAYQAVPTGAIAGPLGQFFFGQLTGFPFTPGTANVYSLTGSILDILSPGFTMVIDVGLGPDGTLYALELDSDGLVFGPGLTGSIFEIASDGSRRLVASGLANPTGMVVDEKGNVFVSVNGFSPDGGEVIRLAPVPLPATLPALAGALGLLAWRARRRARG